MMETTVDNIRDGIIFGLLPGWWMREGHWWEGEDVDAVPGEDEALGPVLTEEEWDAALKTAGFSSVDIVFRDNEYKSRHRVSTLVATRPEEAEVEVALEIWVIIVDAAQVTHAETLMAKLTTVPCNATSELTADMANLTPATAGSTDPPQHLGA